MKWLGFALAVALVGAAACVEKESEKVDDSFVQSNLLTTTPTPQHPVNADLGGKVIYLGCDIDHETAQRRRPREDHALLEGGRRPWLRLEALHPRERSRPATGSTSTTPRCASSTAPDRWKLGDIVRDEQMFPILKTWRSNEAVVYVGMYRKGGQSEQDRMAVKSGPNDGHEPRAGW